MRWALNLRRGLAAAVAASAVLVGVVAVPVGAENDDPCQVYRDEVALQEARRDASASWPEHYLHQARDDLQICADRYPDRFAGPVGGNPNQNDPGKLLDADGNRVAAVPAQPSASQVQSYTYSWLNSPYCGWTGNGVPKPESTGGAGLAGSGSGGGVVWAALGVPVRGWAWGARFGFGGSGCVLGLGGVLRGAA